MLRFLSSALSSGSLALGGVAKCEVIVESISACRSDVAVSKLIIVASDGVLSIEWATDSLLQRSAVLANTSTTRPMRISRSHITRAYHSLDMMSLKRAAWKIGPSDEARSETDLYTPRRFLLEVRESVILKDRQLKREME